MSRIACQLRDENAMGKSIALKPDVHLLEVWEFFPSNIYVNELLIDQSLGQISDCFHKGVQTTYPFVVLVISL